MLFSIQKIRKISIGCILLSMVSCGFLTEDTKAQNTVDTEEIQKDDYIVEPNYEHPKFKELEAAFAKQKHRFEIDRCEFKYNDQSFFIGDSMEKVIGIFGEPDDGKIESDDGSVITFLFEKLELRIRFSTVNKKLVLLKLYLSDEYKHDDTPYKIIKIRKVPYHLDMTLNKFMELSDLEHDKNLKHGSSAFYIINEKECSNTKNLELEIGSEPSYDVIVSGGGHMTTTRTGDFKSKTSSPIERILVRIKK